MMHDKPFGDTAILAQGYTLTATGLENRLPQFKHRDWERIVIGDPKTKQMGRATTAVWLALTHRSPKLIFGTAASCFWKSQNKYIGRKEWKDAGEPTDITWESEYTFNWIFKNFENLQIFPQINNVVLRDYGSFAAAQERLFEIHAVDLISINTATEVNQALKMCYEARFIKGIIRVTNRSHLPRCINDAQTELRTYEIENVTFQQRTFAIYGHPSETDFGEDGNSVTIFEPQSGPPSDSELAGNHLYPNMIMAKFFSLSYEKQQELLRINKQFMET